MRHPTGKDIHPLVTFDSFFFPISTQACYKCVVLIISNIKIFSNQMRTALSGYTTTVALVEAIFVPLQQLLLLFRNSSVPRGMFYANYPLSYPVLLLEALDRLSGITPASIVVSSERLVSMKHDEQTEIRDGGSENAFDEDHFRALLLVLQSLDLLVITEPYLGASECVSSPVVDSDPIISETYELKNTQQKPVTSVLPTPLSKAVPALMRCLRMTRLSIQENIIIAAPISAKTCGIPDTCVHSAIFLLAHLVPQVDQPY